MLLMVNEAAWSKVKEMRLVMPALPGRRPHFFSKKQVIVDLIFELPKVVLPIYNIGTIFEDTFPKTLLFGGEMGYSK